MERDVWKESPLRGSAILEAGLNPGLRPLRGLCPGLTLGLAATRLLGAMRLSFVEDFIGGGVAATPCGRFI